MSHTLRQLRYTVTPAVPAADEGGPIAEIPPLPFIGDQAPRCRDEPDVFEIAGTEGRPGDPRVRADVIAADREAHAICNRCPLLDGCRQYALTTRQRWGVWGGTNLPERIVWLVKYGNEIDHLKGLPVNDEERRRKFADVETIPLFSPEAASVAKSSVEHPRRRPVKAAGYGNCPNCSTTAVRVLISGTHLSWAEHYYRTWGGTTRLCLSSGVSVCTAPEDETACYGARPVQCPHG